MRQIKFRALAVVNNKHAGIKVGDFVYGHYIESGCDAPCIIFGDGEQIEVDKKTLGQLSGMAVKNSKNIYDGDVLDVMYGSKGKMVVEFKHGKYNVSDYLLSKCRLIGNIHQNPEITEVV